MDAGADEYLRKPYNLPELLERVKHGLAQARLRRAERPAPGDSELP